MDSVEYAGEKGIDAIEGALLVMLTSTGQMAIWAAAQGVGYNPVMLNFGFTALLSALSAITIFATLEESGLAGVIFYTIMASGVSSLLFSNSAGSLFVIIGGIGGLIFAHEMDQRL